MKTCCSFGSSLQHVVSNQGSLMSDGRVPALGRRRQLNPIWAMAAKAEERPTDTVSRSAAADIAVYTYQASLNVRFQRSASGVPRLRSDALQAVARLHLCLWRLLNLGVPLQQKDCGFDSLTNRCFRSRKSCRRHINRLNPYSNDGGFGGLLNSHGWQQR